MMEAPDTPQSPHVQEALALGHHIADLIASDQPAAKPDEQPTWTIPTHHSVTLGMYARSRSYYRGVLTLVVHRFGDEAATVSRPLFEDSLRLTILSTIDGEPDRVDAVAGWLLDGARRDEGLHRNAEDLGVGWDHDLALNAINKHRKAVDSYRERKGTQDNRSSDLLRDSRLKAAATSSGRQESWWLYLVVNLMVHGNSYAHRMRARRLPGGGVGYGQHLNEPRWLTTVVGFAAESAVASHRSAAKLLDFAVDQQLDAATQALESVVEMAAQSGES